MTSYFTAFKNIEWRQASQYIKQGVKQQVKEEPLLYWLGLQMVPAAIVTPLTTQYQLKRSPLHPAHQKLLVSQEVIRQMVSASIHFLTYYSGIILGGLLVGASLKDPSKKTAKSLLTFGIGTLSATLGHGIFRPWLINKILLKQLNAPNSQTLESPLLSPGQPYHPFTALA